MSMSTTIKTELTFLKYEWGFSSGIYMCLTCIDFWESGIRIKQVVVIVGQTSAFSSGASPWRWEHHVLMSNRHTTLWQSTNKHIVWFLTAFYFSCYQRSLRCLKHTRSVVAAAHPNIYVPFCSFYGWCLCYVECSITGFYALTFLK